MKISSVIYSQNSDIGFGGKLVLPNKLSDKGKLFVEKCGEEINKILEPAPYDLFLKEIPEKNNQIILCCNKGEEPGMVIVYSVCEIISSFKRQKMAEEIKKEFERFEKDARELRNIGFNDKPRKVKPYIPLKIGKPQKPYVKKRY